MRVIAVILVSLLLVACAGDGGGGDSKGAIAAKACEAFAKNGLGGKTYQLDLNALAASMKADGDMQALSASIVIEPGLSGEVKQTLDCKVRFNAEGTQADVISLNYIFQ